MVWENAKNEELEFFSRRKVVEFRYLEEHSAQETAQILGISTAAVKSRMFHVRVALRRMPSLNK
jgi:DNA-directed RNA polymerase specialized sigma24 family protein